MCVNSGVPEMMTRVVSLPSLPTTREQPLRLVLHVLRDGFQLKIQLSSLFSHLSPHQANPLPQPPARAPPPPQWVWACASGEEAQGGGVGAAGRGRVCAQHAVLRPPHTHPRHRFVRLPLLWGSVASALAPLPPAMLVRRSRRLSCMLGWSMHRTVIRIR